MTAASSSCQRVLRAAVLIAAILLLLVEPLAAAARFFIARFDGHKLPAHLEDVDAAFVVSGGTVRRTTSGQPVGYASAERHYVRTERADYLSTDWTYEITFTTPAYSVDDLLFIGFGEAVPDPLFFDEPRNSIYFRIHLGMNGFGGTWNVDVMAHDIGVFSNTYWVGLGTLGGPAGGTYTARIRKVGPQVTFEILGTPLWVAIPDIAAAAPFLHDVPVHVFFGAANTAYPFDDMRLLRERLTK